MERVFLAGVRPVSSSKSDTFLLLRHGRRPTGVAVELGRLWFVRYKKRAIRVPFLGYSGGAAMYNQNPFVRGGRRHHRETWRDLGYGRREGSCRQVPGLAAKTEEEER